MNSKAIGLILALMLGGCQGANVTPTSTVDLIADAIKVELPIILPSLSASQQADITRYAGVVEAARQTIDADFLAGKPVNVSMLVVALQALAPIVSANLAPNNPAAIAIASAVALAPLILAEADVVGAAKKIVPMDVEKNKMVLRSVVR